ncbi:uncharacterized protein LOC131859854 isoform X2 [Cryptomeria japonica]|uniref:uncharacterized protein LOC131859854 isoform X2 n=1 Tax=Cryptomeria japonica TaxID=3369 RepID=UPI0027DA600C|nr:uncharacterized protein LOC131859854 isoform X2 [Cryptomeria japonica]
MTTKPSSFGYSFKFFWRHQGLWFDSTCELSVNDPFVMTTRSTFMFLQMVMHIISMHWIWKCKVHQPHYFCVTSVLDSSFFLKSSTSIMNENLCICCCG